MNLHNVFLNNLKDVNYRHVLLTGTDNCDSKLSKNILFENSK